jgi:hypothetical protein
LGLNTSFAEIPSPKFQDPNSKGQIPVLKKIENSEIVNSKEIVFRTLGFGIWDLGLGSLDY